MIIEVKNLTGANIEQNQSAGQSQYEGLKQTFTHMSNGQEWMNYDQFKEAWDSLNLPNEDDDINKAWKSVDVYRNGLILEEQFIYSIMGDEFDPYSVPGSLDNLTQLLTQCAVEYRSYMESNGTLNVRVAELTEQIDGRGDEMENMVNELSTSSARIQELEELQRQTSEDMGKVMDDLIAKTNKVQELEQDIVKYTEQNENLNKTVADLAEALEQERASNDAERITELEEAMEKANKSVADLTAEKTQLAAEIKSYQTQSEENSSQMDAAREAFEAEKKEMQEKFGDALGAELANACRAGDTKTVKRLIGNGAPVSWSDGDGRSLAYTSSWKGNLDCLKLLADAGANLLSPKNDGATPVFVASQNGKIECLKFLAERGADLTSPSSDGSTPVLTAAHFGRLECLQFLYKNGADLTTSNFNGATPVILATQAGQIDSLRFLCENGADLNTPYSNGATPAFIASGKGELDCLQYLADNGADLSIPLNDGTTPLDIAKANGHHACVELLKERSK